MAQLFQTDSLSKAFTISLIKAIWNTAAIEMGPDIVWVTQVDMQLLAFLSSDHTDYAYRLE